MVLIDTNILIELYRKNGKIVAELQTQIGEENMFVSVVTVGELLYGAKDKQELVNLKNDLGGLITYKIDNHIWDKFVEIRNAIKDLIW